MSIRIAFWGTPSLTETYLDALKAANMSPVVIITNPDRPKGRGHELAAPPAKEWATANNIPVLQPNKLDEAFKEDFSKYAVDVSVVVAYGSIMPKSIIDIPQHGTLNVHYSLLPRWRGAAPTEAAILAGDVETGASIQVMRSKLDSGPIVAEARTSIGEDETTPKLRQRLSMIGAALLVKILPDYIAGKHTPKEQDENLATHVGKIQKEDARIDLSADALSNYRKYRAYYEWPRVFFMTNDAKRVIITKARYEKDAFVIERVLPEGKKEMSYSDFLRGVK